MADSDRLGTDHLLKFSPILFCLEHQQYNCLDLLSFTFNRTEESWLILTAYPISKWINPILRLGAYLPLFGLLFWNILWHGQLCRLHASSCVFLQQCILKFWTSPWIWRGSLVQYACQLLGLESLHTVWMNPVEIYSSLISEPQPDTDGFPTCSACLSAQAARLLRREAWHSAAA